MIFSSRLPWWERNALLEQSQLISRVGFDRHGRRLYHVWGSQWVGKARILSNSNSTKELRSYRLGYVDTPGNHSSNLTKGSGLGTMLYNFDAYQSFYLHVPAAHSQHQDGQAWDVCTHGSNGDFQHGLRLLVSRSLQTAWGLLERERSRSLFLKARSHEHHRRSWRYAFEDDRIGYVADVFVVLSIITDLICAALPAIFLRNLQISKKTKIGLSLLMGMGVM